MRERRRLDEAITATRAIESGCADTAELIELAEREGDEALVDEAVASLAPLAARAEDDKHKALPAGSADAHDPHIQVHPRPGGNGRPTQAQKQPSPAKTEA